MARCWYQRTLKHCSDNLVVHWMAVILVPDTSVGDLVALGSFSTVIHADIGDNVMISPRVSVVRGAHQHGFARLGIPMNYQPGQPRKVTIGDDVWIGMAAVILADVASGRVVGAGAVVNKTFQPYSILAGLPAKVIGQRGPALEDGVGEAAA